MIPLAPLDASLFFNCSARDSMLFGPPPLAPVLGLALEAVAGRVPKTALENSL